MNETSTPPPALPQQKKIQRRYPFSNCRGYSVPIPSSYPQHVDADANGLAASFSHIKPKNFPSKNPRVQGRSGERYPRPNRRRGC